MDLPGLIDRSMAGKIRTMHTGLKSTHFISKLIGHNPPIANHVSSDPGSLIGPVNACLNHMLKSMIKMVQDIAYGLNFIPEIKKSDTGPGA